MKIVHMLRKLKLAPTDPIQNYDTVSRRGVEFPVFRVPPHPNFPIDKANILDMIHSASPVNFFPKGGVLEVDVQRFFTVIVFPFHN